MLFLEKIKTMRKIDQLFAEYAESHQNQTNKLIHWICVPLIFFTIVGFISLIPTITTTKALNKLGHYTDWTIVHFHFGYSFISLISILAIIFLTIFYIRLSKIIGIIMFSLILLMFYCTSIINQIYKHPGIIYLSIFVITWIFQFVGLKIEGKKPSILKDLQFLLIGPIWLLHFVLKKLGIKY